jgi:hypothetical protein
LLSAGGVGEGVEGGFLAGVQFVLVSATMPRSLDGSVGAYIPVSGVDDDDDFIFYLFEYFYSALSSCEL